jgi:hypothetical protein
VRDGKTVTDGSRKDGLAGIDIYGQEGIEGKYISIMSDSVMSDSSYLQLQAGDGVFQCS